jgi:hypothetical protein
MKVALTLCVGFFLSLVVTSLAIADEATPIPKKVLKELNFMAGKWQTDMTEDGVAVGTATHERKWSPGEYCLIMNWCADKDGVKSYATAVSGWNPKGKAVVEHWYGSDGSYGSVRYPLGKMKNDAWEGTHRFIEADGKEMKGSCRLEKGDGQWIFTADWEDEGKKVTMRNVTRKVKE